MTTTTSTLSLLRLALRTDAVVSGANGAAYVLAAGWLSDLLGLPTDILRELGAFLIVFAVAVWFVGERPQRPAVGAVVAANALWAAGSLVVLATGLGSPTLLGAVWIGLQAVVVAAFAVLQARGLRRLGLSGRWAPSAHA